MTTSSVTTFNLDLNNIVEEAFERCGAELRSGYDMRTARRSLNLLMLEWANRGINLWTIEQGQITLTTGQISYAIPTDTVDLLDHVIRTGTASNQQDINISRISEPTYMTIPNKTTTGRPIQVWVNRQSGNISPTTVTVTTAVTTTATTITVSNVALLPSNGFVNIDAETIYYQAVSTANNQLLNCSRAQNGTTAATHPVLTYVSINYLPNINVWPTPETGTTYTFVYYRMRRIQDAGGGGVYMQDIPFRWIPCMAAGLAYYLSIKIPEVDPNRAQLLKADYEQQFDLAAQEDREKAANRYVPRMSFYR
jgi:hypothetical protein